MGIEQPGWGATGRLHGTPVPERGLTWSLLRVPRALQQPEQRLGRDQGQGPARRRTGPRRACRWARPALPQRWTSALWPTVCQPAQASRVRHTKESAEARARSGACGRAPHKGRRVGAHQRQAPCVPPRLNVWHRLKLGDQRALAFSCVAFRALWLEPRPGLLADRVLTDSSSRQRACSSRDAWVGQEARAAAAALVKRVSCPIILTSLQPGESGHPFWQTATCTLQACCTSQSSCCSTCSGRSRRSCRTSWVPPLWVPLRGTMRATRWPSSRPMICSRSPWCTTAQACCRASLPSWSTLC